MKAPAERWVILLLAGSLPALFLVALAFGVVPVPIGSVLEALTQGGDSELGLVLWEVRAPRAVLAMLVGAALGLAGAAMQGYLRNPLADPGVLGVSAGAAFGAVCLFYTGLAGVHVLALPAGGLTGAALSVALLLLLAGPSAGAHSLILAGVALSSLFGALTSLAISLSPNPWAMGEITLWLLGSIADRSWPQVLSIVPFLALGAVFVHTARPGLRALSLGEDTAASLGIDLGRLRWQVVVGCSLLVGAATAVAGAIAFVGLVVPHLMRPVVRGDPARLLPISALGGAVLLPLADLFVRISPTGAELRLGVVTALVGAPFFLMLLLDLRRARP